VNGGDGGAGGITHILCAGSALYGNVEFFNCIGIFMTHPRKTQVFVFNVGYL
jgi:hypothetical protein